jgi:uncharacterized cupin superfamily protein
MYVPDIHSLPLRDITDSSSPATAPRCGDWVLADDGLVQIGVWSASPGTLAEPTGDYVETMFMVSGRATVSPSDADGVYDLVPGALWATPRHWVGPWEIDQVVRKVYVIDHRPAVSAEVGVSPENGASAYLSNAYTCELDAPVRRPVVIAGDPHEASRSLWAHERLECGVWECTPGEFPFRRDGYDEVFCVLSGHATLHTDGGQMFELIPGAVILTPAGLTGRWVVHRTIRKAYTVILDRG